MSAVRFSGFRFLYLSSFILLVCSFAAAQTPRVTFDSSETVFSAVTAINACGYDQELSVSDPLRQQVRAQVTKTTQGSPEANSALEQACTFYRDHRQLGSSAELSQYVSLALQLGAPPKFDLAVPEADLSPDAGYVQGFVPLLRRFYAAAGLHQIWTSHKADYDALIARYHDPIANMLQATDVYLKLPMSTYNGRRFTVIVEPMAAPSQVNARDYTSEYFVVLAPEHGGLRTQAIRHLYLHSIVDPISGQHPSAMKRLEPLLDRVASAPLDASFKRDISILVTESLIRAIEARTSVGGKGKAAEAEREQKTLKAAGEGFILAPYFGQQLAAFEKIGSSLTVAYPEWLHDLDLSREQKRAAAIVFAASASSEDGHASRARPSDLLDESERRLAAGDTKGAQELAQQALDHKTGDPARALFLLARIATVNRDMEGARNYFERTLAVAHAPHLVAWSNIYLGRICDLKEEREQAIAHYHAAQAAGDDDAATHAAIEQGLQRPYEPPVAPQRHEPE